MTKEAIGPLQISIRPALLAAIAKWAYQSDDTRPHMGIVRFGDGEIVALDGHRAVLVPCENAQRVTFGIEAKHCAAIAAAYKAAGLRFGEVTIDVPPEAIGVGQHKTRVMLAPGFEMWVPITSASGYPLYRNVIPDPPTTDHPPRYRLDVRYLSAIEEVCREHTHGYKGELRILSWTAIGSDGISGPPMFEGPGGMRFIVMPMREPEAPFRKGE